MFKKTKISSNLNWFVRTISEFEANITSIERIKEYFDIKHEVFYVLIRIDQNFI